MNKRQLEKAAWEIALDEFLDREGLCAPGGVEAWIRRVTKKPKRRAKSMDANMDSKKHSR